MRAVILAGGKGTRLRPYTTSFPKPLMPIGDRPILEIVLLQLKAAGFTQVTMAVGHLASLLIAYFGDGSKLGVDIEYSMESEPLGTAGPLGLIEGLDEPFLVLNGDLLTDLDFAEMYRRHAEAGSVATIGLYRREVKIDLGVIETNDDGSVAGYVEKPVYDLLVSMGVYVLSPAVRDRIPENTHIDLPDLITGLLADGAPVAGHVHDGYWLDIGRPDDYERAQDDFEARVGQFLEH
jgi:NDP-sugar pyrophosphorylase family protein